MFTGIVEELGEVTGVEQLPNAARMTVRGPRVTEDAAHGDSIAVNGVCLTVVDVAGGEFGVDVVDETLQRSGMAKVQVGDRVNLERATAVGERLGGHIMQGHVDGTGVFLTRDPQGLATFAMPPALSRYLVQKGSIAVDGVSLTVAATSAEEFQVALIPTTLELTTLGRREPGDLVNLEVDVLAKYVEKLASAHLPGQAKEHHGGTEEWS
ncbi:riboflavin synthase [Amycolatopsis cihanbeyliensis]|uniref:Riboflavin synthase n=1 Tax=Amycolatopsis cihanbeyliensis TaxID=1128664 RepID=A0A542CSV0_AMYCI|nr:riboflavin synthase [Amycolatopsis cihanbeyliensis]TQI93907.1 riboflavin synthase alpha chain [Amycolatopsis cihanbeyliensis]